VKFKKLVGGAGLCKIVNQTSPAALEETFRYQLRADSKAIHEYIRRATGPQ